MSSEWIEVGLCSMQSVIKGPRLAKAMPYSTGGLQHHPEHHHPARGQGETTEGHRGSHYGPGREMVFTTSAELLSVGQSAFMAPSRYKGGWKLSLLAGRLLPSNS